MRVYGLLIHITIGQLVLLFRPCGEEEEEEEKEE